MMIICTHQGHTIALAPPDDVDAGSDDDRDEESTPEGMVTKLAAVAQWLPSGVTQVMQTQQMCNKELSGQTWGRW